MPFGVVNGIGRGIRVLDVVHVPNAKGSFCSHWFEWHIFSRNVFDSCVKSSQYFHTDNISLETSVHWPSEGIARFEIDVGVYEKFANM